MTNLGNGCKLRNLGIAAACSLTAVGGTLCGSSVVAGASQTNAGNIVGVNGYSSYTFAIGQKGALNPDDIASMGGNVFAGWQNGVGPMGEPSTTAVIPGSNPPKLGQLNSTIVEYKLAGGSFPRKPIATWSVKGHVDGLAADPATNRLLVSVNEDGNSSLYTIPVGGGSVQSYTYNPDPTSLGGGGTDAITIQNGSYYITGSNPSAPNAPVLYKMALANGTANLTPLFNDNAAATGPNGPVTLALTDPDSNNVVPSVSPSYAGDLVVNSQAESQLIFVQNPGSASQSLNQVPTGAAIDDITWATASKGTLLLSDNTDNRIVAITTHFTKGTAYVSMASDSGVGHIVGTINLLTGLITPVEIGFSNPHGMIFIPSS
jgi:hypothetical protein